MSSHHIQQQQHLPATWGVSRLHIQSFMLIIILIAKLVILPILTIIVVLSVIIVESGNLASLFIAAVWSFFTASPQVWQKSANTKWKQEML